jgi:hypothetical protein
VVPAISTPIGVAKSSPHQVFVGTAAPSRAVNARRCPESEAILLGDTFWVSAGWHLLRFCVSAPSAFHKLLPAEVSNKLTIEGELNKLASNVAMGRSMGGVHWRSDNTRSLILGEVLAAQILSDITVDLNEKPRFEFRSFARDEYGNPKLITIQQGQIRVNGIVVPSGTSGL